MYHFYSYFTNEETGIRKPCPKGGKKAYFGIEEHVIFLPDQDTFERESTLVIEKKMLVLKAYFVCSKTPR